MGTGGQLQHHKGHPPGAVTWQRNPRCACSRLAARRAVPRHIHSDNAKEFRAAAEALKHKGSPQFYEHEWSNVNWTFSPL